MRRERLKSLTRVCRQIFGIPDYERYLEHMRKHHPLDPVMTAREFCARSIDRKYQGNGPRCC